MACLIANGSGEAALEEVWTSPALLRLATELTTNALDNSRRSESQKRIDVKVTPTSFHVSNDGDTLSVEKFEGGEKWVPEVAFSEFLSSTNYDDSVERLGAGRNGVGAKGCNVYSTRFEVEVQNEGRQFRQEWRDNLTASIGPSVKKIGSKKSHTKVTWCPDLALLKAGEEESDETSERDAAEREEGGERARSRSKKLTQKEMEALRSLAYHVAVCAPPRVGVFLDDRKVQIKSTEQLAASLGAMRPIATDTVELDGELRLSLSVGVKEETFTSGEAESTIFCFVNGTPCSEGTHVKSLLSKVWEIVQQKASKKDQDLKSSLKPSFLVNSAGIVMVCTLLVPNPRYANQQKTELATPLREFGFTYSPSERFAAKLASTDLVCRAIRYGKRMLDSKLSSKKHSSASSSRVSVPKYQPAEKLRSGEASLFVTEGDAALNFAVAGLSVVGRKHYGVFPIRGKLLNCCNASSKKLLENKEVQHLLAILGLDVGRMYTGEEKLNYEHLIVLSDQDPDGSHIRGLLICFLHSLVPTLLETRPDYVQCFATPLLRVLLPHKEGIVDFFSGTDYRAWTEDRQRRSLPLGRSTYYKGLGALPNALAKEIFSRDNFRRHLVTLRYEGKDACGDRIALFFDEGMADRRKEYLSVQYDPAASFDFSADSASIKEWCEKDLSHYAMYNNTRTFPSVVDGLKTSQRKVLHACFKFNLTTQKEMKVYQLVGKVAAETGYHHGDASLTATITTMAAEHCNNVVLLWPEGQFGSAMCHKPASSRYISTCLEPIARKIFRPEDDPVLEYVEDEGKHVEPVHFVPIVPMVLFNGASGIGSGWSTDCPSFQPMDVLNAVLAEVEQMEARAAAEREEREEEEEEGVPQEGYGRKEDGEKKQSPAFRGSELIPWYRGFEGTIQHAFPHLPHQGHLRATEGRRGRAHHQPPDWLEGVERGRGGPQEAAGGLGRDRRAAEVDSVPDQDPHPQHACPAERDRPGRHLLPQEEGGVRQHPSVGRV